MCGRFTLRTPMSVLLETFQAGLDEPFALSPRYNVAPTQTVPIVRLDESNGSRQLARATWGLVPSWSKDAKSGVKAINARGETVAEKPAFRAAFKRRRCLVPVDGFYEWRAIGKAKQPYFIHRLDDGPFAMAGLWESWRGVEPPLASFTIITTAANELMRPLHDRMPVILHPADYAAWLDPARERAELESLIVPYDGQEFITTAVSTVVNNARNETPQCVEPAANPKT